MTDQRFTEPDLPLIVQALDEWRQRATTAEGRLARGLRELDRLTDIIQADCNGEYGVCHGFDLTDDYQCALVTDLKRITDTFAGVTR